MRSLVKSEQNWNRQECKFIFFCYVIWFFTKYRIDHQRIGFFLIWIFPFCFTFSGIFESTSRELNLIAAKCSGKKPRSEIWHKDWKTATEVSLFYFAFLRVSRPSCLLLIGSKLRSMLWQLFWDTHYLLYIWKKRITRATAAANYSS